MVSLVHCEFRAVETELPEYVGLLTLKLQTSILKLAYVVHKLIYVAFFGLTAFVPTSTSILGELNQSCSSVSM